MTNIFVFTLFIISVTQSLPCSETTFIATDLSTRQPILALGGDLDCRVTPGCTFNIPLSLIGYDLHILSNENLPVWPYDGSKVPIEAHKAPQSPTTWMTLSVVWYSKKLARQIGHNRLQQYVSTFSYGNMDVSGNGVGPDAFVTAHLCSSLTISPREQVQFIENLLSDKIAISKQALAKTKTILLNQTLSSGWSLFGKTGTCLYDSPKTIIAWYVGWIEKGNTKYPFALLIRDSEGIPSKEERQQLVKNYFMSCGIPALL